MYKNTEARKFIISETGELRIGNFCENNPYLHKALLKKNETTCFGGGYVYILIDEQKILMFGESIDYGMPCFDKWKSFDEEETRDWQFIYKKEIFDVYERVLDTSTIIFGN